MTFTSGRRIGTSAPLEIGSSSTFTSTRKAFPRFVGWSEWVQERFRQLLILPGAGAAGRVKVTQILEGPFSASSKSLFAGKVSKLSC